MTRLFCFLRQAFRPSAVLICVGLALGQAFAIARAQATDTLPFDQPVTGTITDAAFRVVYVFEGRSGDIIDLSLTRTDGNLDPQIVLTDDQNKLVARSGNTGDSYTAEIRSQHLPHDGTYFVVATRFGQERGLTTGGYMLKLSHVGTANAADGIALRYGDSIVAEINDQQPEIVYSFKATRGDIIRISMQRISDDLDAYLILADASGNILTTNDEDPASPGTLDAAITNWRIEKTGSYVIVATRFGRAGGTSRGHFSLTLDQLSAAQLGTSAENAILIDYNTHLDGTIDDKTYQRFYLIQAAHGDVVSVGVERTQGNLDPTLNLYSPDRKAILPNDSGLRGQDAKISPFSIPTDGDYLLVVSRFNADKGITAGSYTLTVNGLHGVTVNPRGVTALSYNSAASALIDDTHASTQFSFTGAAGDSVTITMSVSSGDLQPDLELLDNNKLLIRDIPGTHIAKIQAYKLKSAGTYTILATRYGHEKGVSRGAYVLTLVRETP
jgi:hypothetical protein